MRLLPLSALLLLLPGCLDNSGGDPPPGEGLEFSQIEFAMPLWCDPAEDLGTLIDDQADIDAWLDTCFAEQDDRDLVDESLQGHLGNLLEGQRLLLVQGMLGGCIQQWDLFDVKLDGAVVRPWMVKADTSHGVEDVACTADLGQRIELLWIEGADAATSVEVHVGVYNPDLPDAPALPGG